MHILSRLSVLHLRFSARLRQNAILTSAPGATLRGALYHALTRLFDDDPMVAWLLSTARCWMPSVRSWHAALTRRACPR